MKEKPDDPRELCLSAQVQSVWYRMFLSATSCRRNEVELICMWTLQRARTTTKGRWCDWRPPGCVAIAITSRAAAESSDTVPNEAPLLLFVTPRHQFVTRSSDHTTVRRMRFFFHLSFFSTRVFQPAFICRYSCSATFIILSKNNWSLLPLCFTLSGISFLCLFVNLILAPVLPFPTHLFFYPSLLPLLIHQLENL